MASPSGLATIAGIALKQFGDESRRLQFIEQLHADSEHFHCDGFDVPFVESMFFNNVFDQSALLFRAAPQSFQGRFIETGSASRELRPAREASDNWIFSSKSLHFATRVASKTEIS